MDRIEPDGRHLHAHIDWAKLPAIPPTLPALLDHAAGQFADRALMIEDAGTLLYGEAIARSAALARHLLAHGIGKGSRVGMLLPNGIEFVVTWLAIARIGAVAVPISTLSSPSELCRIARLGGVALLIGTTSFARADMAARIEEAFGLPEGGATIANEDAPQLRAIWLWGGTRRWATTIDEAAPAPLTASLLAAAERTVTPADEIAIIFTSGSTADPKGVIHSHGTFLRSARRWTASMPFVDGDRLFATLPMFWVGGLVVNLLSIMQVGGTLLTSAGTPAEMLDMIERERCTLIQVFPALGRRLAEDPGFAGRDFGAMRGGTVPEMILPGRWPAHRAPFAFAMGMSETAGPHSMAMGDLDADHAGAMGLPGIGMEHRIVDPETHAILPDGERGILHLRGDTLMLGYVGRERTDVFDADGWFDTGDICSIRDGYLFFHGRSGAMIKTAGANVAPPEVEVALLSLDGVAEAHVLGLPDEERGEIVGALLVPRSGSRLDPATVLAGARRLLSAYKVPRRLLIVDAPPLTGTNKLDRRAATQLLLSPGAIPA